MRDGGETNMVDAIQQATQEYLGLRKRLLDFEADLLQDPNAGTMKDALTLKPNTDIARNKLIKAVQDHLTNQGNEKEAKEAMIAGGVASENYDFLQGIIIAAKKAMEEAKEVERREAERFTPQMLRRKERFK